TSALSTLSLHDALPICGSAILSGSKQPALIGTSGKMCLIARYTAAFVVAITLLRGPRHGGLDSEKSKCRSVPSFLTVRNRERIRSEEHTSELQSLRQLV